MTYEIFEYAPKSGDYGTDWLRVMCLESKASALHVAEHFAQQRARHIRVFSAPKRGIGRMIAEFPGTAEMCRHNTARHENCPKCARENDYR